MVETRHRRAARAGRAGDREASRHISAN